MAYPQGAALRQRDRSAIRRTIHGGGRGPEFEAISIDYARYNYYNIGFRTGLNVFRRRSLDYYSIPMQFTWRRTYGVGMAQKQGRRLSEQRPLWQRLLRESEPDWGSAFLTTLFSILPSAFEVHTGFTPGMMFGPLSLPPYDGDFSSDTASAVLSMSARG
ncbi:MAG: hypothetical protein ACLRM8_05230 [Alistipes sp.]